MEHSETTQTDYGTGEKTLTIYCLGMVLCIILTLIPFYVVMNAVFSVTTNFIIIFTSAILQFLVQVKCFLRLNFLTEQSKMNVLTFIFTLAIIAIVIAGILWIMWNLNYNMMQF